MFDPPFYGIILFLIPLFSQLFLLDPPVPIRNQSKLIKSVTSCGGHLARVDL